MKAVVGNHEFSYKSGDEYFFALSDYPFISTWELKKLVSMAEYEKAHGRELQIVCENERMQREIFQALAKPETVKNAAVPEKITECTACYQKGCLTKYVCHTTSVENARSIFASGKILSAIGAKGKTGEELAKDPSNAAGDPPDFFGNIMFAWGNCQAGDRLVTERMLNRFPTEQDLSIDFHPGIRFYFVHDDIVRHPNYLFDGFDPAKIKDEIVLSHYLYACIIPKEYEQSFRKIIPDCLSDRIHYLENDCKDIWEWAEKVYNFVVSLHG